MLDYGNDSFTLCLQLNKAKRPLQGRDGSTENINDEEQLDRIFARSDKKIYAGPVGDITAKRIVVQEMRFHNPYVFLIVKVVSNDDSNLIKECNELEWQDSIYQMKIQVNKLKGTKE